MYVQLTNIYIYTYYVYVYIYRHINHSLQGTASTMSAIVVATAALRGGGCDFGANGIFHLKR